MFCFIQYINLWSQLNKINNILFKLCCSLFSYENFTTFVLNKLQHALLALIEYSSRIAEYAATQSRRRRTGLFGYDCLIRFYGSK